MKKALIVVDYQKDFVDGALGFEKAVQLEQAICRKIEQAREQGEEILFTFDTHGDDYLQTQEGRNLPIEHCKKGSDGWQLYGKVEQLRCPEDRCFDKPGAAVRCHRAVWRGFQYLCAFQCSAAQGGAAGSKVDRRCSLHSQQR